MCIDNMVDIKDVHKDSINISDGKTWTTQGQFLYYQFHQLLLPDYYIRLFKTDCFPSTYNRQVKCDSLYISHTYSANVDQ